MIEVIFYLVRAIQNWKKLFFICCWKGKKKLSYVGWNIRLPRDVFFVLFTRLTISLSFPKSLYYHLGVPQNTLLIKYIEPVHAKRKQKQKTKTKHHCNLISHPNTGYSLALEGFHLPWMNCWTQWSRAWNIFFFLFFDILKLQLSITFIFIGPYWSYSGRMCQCFHRTWTRRDHSGTKQKVQWSFTQHWSP